MANALKTGEVRNAGMKRQFARGNNAVWFSVLTPQTYQSEALQARLPCLKLKFF